MRTLKDLERYSTCEDRVTYGIDVKADGEFIHFYELHGLIVERVWELQVAIKNFQTSPNPPVSLDIIREYRGAINELMRMFNLTEQDIKELTK
jgi:hypothetical protein